MVADHTGVGRLSLPGLTFTSTSAAHVQVREGYELIGGAGTMVDDVTLAMARRRPHDAGRHGFGSRRPGRPVSPLRGSCSACDHSPVLPDIVGRQADLDAIEAFLQAMLSGFACLVLSGEAGIGKSTLWAEAIRRARVRGVAVLSCRPVEAEARLSFAALSDLLGPASAHAFDAIPVPQRRALDVALLRTDDHGSPAEPRAVAAGLRGVLTAMAEASPVLVAVDDSQWLDGPSASALAFALRRLDGERVGALLARRPVAPRAPDRLRVPAAQFVELGPLSLAAIHELVKGRLGRSLARPLLVRLYETSRGNPFFALEIAREIVQSGIGPTDPLPVPPDLRRLVRRRLGRLSPAAREALLVAAALGEPTRELLVAALDSDPSGALDEAEAAEVVELDEGRIRFAHPLYAAAIYAAASRDRRRRLHRRLSEVVTDVEERARHLAVAATAPSKGVAGVLEQAARQARTRGAAATAAALFADASRLTPSDDERTGHARLLRAAEAHFDSADTSAARALVERLIATVPPGPDRARARLLMAVVHAYEDGPVPAKEDCLQAMDEAGEDLLLQAEANLRLSLVCVDDFDLARRSTRRAVELVRMARDAPDDLVACALLDDAYIRFLTGHGLDRAQVAEAEQVMPPHGRTWLAERAHSVLYEWAKYTDELVRARELLQETAARRRAVGDEYIAAITDHHLAEVECWLGHWSRAREYAAAGGAVIEQAGNRLWRAVALSDRALIAAHLGAQAEARDAALEGLALAEQAQDPWLSTGLLSILGFLDLSLDDLTAADRWLSRAASTVESIGLAEPARFRFHGDHIEAVVGLGQIDRARDLLLQLQRRAEVAPRPWILIMSARSEGILHAASGELDRALEAFETALRQHESLEMPFERARTLLCVGRVRRRQKQRKAAREALQQSLAIFEQLGAPLWANKARSELERTHVREAPQDLTPTERRVAELAATGQTNRVIAELLFLSPKTVEGNLARVYRMGSGRARSWERRWPRAPRAHNRRETPHYSPDGDLYPPGYLMPATGREETMRPSPRFARTRLRGRTR
jgi:DNA-binding CsgD family transcriptional regulator